MAQPSATLYHSTLNDILFLLLDFINIDRLTYANRFNGLGVSELITNHEVAGSIPGTSTILNVD